MANEKKEQRVTRRPKVKGKTYAKVNRLATRMHEVAAGVSVCGKCRKEAVKSCICSTLTSSPLTKNEARRELCGSCGLIPTSVCSVHRSAMEA